MILRGLFTQQACLSGHSLGYLAWLPTLQRLASTGSQHFGSLGVLYLGAGRILDFPIFQVLTAKGFSTCLLGSSPCSCCFCVCPTLGVGVGEQL